MDRREFVGVAAGLALSATASAQQPKRPLVALVLGGGGCRGYLDDPFDVPYQGFSILTRKLAMEEMIRRMLDGGLAPAEAAIQVPAQGEM